MSTSRRVLALLPGAFGDSGGVALYNRDLIRALVAREGLEVRALGLHGDPAAVPSSAEHAVEAPLRDLSWRVPAAGSKTAFAAAALADALRRRPRLVISGLAGFAPLALAARALTGARLWTVTHGLEVFHPGSRIERRGLERSDVVTAVSRFTRDRLRAWCPVPLDRIRLLPGAVDLERFTPGPPPAGLAARYRSGERPILLTVGRLHPQERYKGQDRLIRLLPRLIEKRGPVLYLIVGDGADRPRLEELARTSGVAGAVVFAGYAGDRELAGYYRLADLFAMPSTGEGLGIVFLEAMACGCPVLGGNRDGSVDALAGGELGTLVDPLDDDALLAGLEGALAGRPRRDRPIPGVERFSTARFHRQVAELLAALDL